MSELWEGEKTIGSIEFETLQLPLFFIVQGHHYRRTLEQNVGSGLTKIPLLFINGWPYEHLDKCAGC